MGFKGKYKNRLGVVLCLMLLASMLVACGQEQVQDSQTVSTEQTKTQDFQAVSTEQTEEPNQTQESNQAQESVQSEQEPTPMTILEDGSIAEQTFEVELSEYDGMVTFVPYVPDAENPVLHMEIKQNAEVLTTIKGYVPEALKDAEFVSLDAVSFYDVNYDNYTDIVLVETYGDTTFVAIYYGFAKDAGEYDRYFYVQRQFSEEVTVVLNSIGEVSVSGLRTYLAEGKKNGEFSSYQEAYKAVCALKETEYEDERQYNLIYFDEDDIPELVVGKNGYYVSLYTYRDGRVYTLMDQWGYGAMGNAGYEYVPYQNSLRNYNTDHAGAVLYTTYMAMDENCSLETIAEIVTYNFDDANQNGMPDEEEMASMGMYGVTYVNGVEETANESVAYDAGEYEYILGDMSLEELKERL